MPSSWFCFSCVICLPGRSSPVVSAGLLYYRGRVLLIQQRPAGSARPERGSLVPLAGDASSRSYARLHLDGSVPATAVVMVLAGSALPLSSEELAVFAEPLKELPYLNLYRFLRPLGVRVPELYYDGQKDGFLLLEYIGDVFVREAAQQLPAVEVERLYRRAIDQLVLLQIDGTRRRDPSCIAFQQRFDQRLFLWEFEHFIAWGLEKR